MPVINIPVVHKFGIISSNQRLELQERLQKQAYIDSNKRNQTCLSQRDPLTVTEEFVQLFNSADNFEDKEKYEEKARKFLERAKRRSGVKNCGRGDHVNLPLAWTEMVQLAQCKGRIQKECMDILVTSLDVSPLERYHIAALFFLAETMLYWLRTEEVLHPFLRTGEIKLLKMGHLVFERLFYHHMAGQLHEYMDCKRRLCTYTEGLEKLQELYDLYPNALLYLRFVTEVGKIILADCELEQDGDSNSDKVTDIPQQSSVAEIPEQSSVVDIPEQSSETLNLDTKDMYEYYSYDEIRSSRSGAISSSVHDLTPTLWHALDLFRCTNSLSGGLSDALKSLNHCGFGLSSETWVDGIVAIQIVGESAKINIASMKALHSLAQGVRTAEDLSTTMSLSSRSGHSVADGIFDETSDLGMTVTQSETLTVPHGILFGHGSTLNDIGDRKLDNDSTDIKQDHDSSDFKQDHDSTDFKQDDTTDIKHENDSIDFKQDDTTDIKHDNDSTDFKQDHDSTDFKHDKDRIESTDAGGQLQQTPGISGWHWEVALTYTEVLENIVLYGSSADIQKLALVGCNSYNDNLQHHSCGLVDLVFFNARKETTIEVMELDPNDWSWRIRYGAIQSLVKICRSLKGDDAHEGLRTTAWNVLLKANATEKDCRVMEALKVAQLHTDSNRMLHPSLQELPVSLGKRIAEGLSAIYLPPIPPPTAAPPRMKYPSKSHTAINVPVKPSETKLLRTSLKQEIKLASALNKETPDYNTRTGFDLRRIVEDQWRKELQAKLEEEKKEELDALKEKQQKEEDRQKQIAASKQNKFKKKSLI